MRVTDLAFMPIFGASGGLLPVVGFNFGARLWHRLWGAVRLASFGLAAIMGIATVLLEIFTPQLISIFTNDPELMTLAVPAVRITVSTVCVFASSIMFIATFQGLAKGREALGLSLARQLIFFLPALLILPRFLGINGVWLSIPVSDVPGFLLSGLWLFREYKIQQRIGEWADMLTSQV